MRLGEWGPPRGQVWPVTRLGMVLGMQAFPRFPWMYMLM